MFEQCQPPNGAISPRSCLSEQTAKSDEFVPSGYPHLEEAYQVGEGVLPLLGRATG